MSVCIDIYMCSVAQLCATLCNSKDHSLPGTSVHSDSPGKNTVVGCHALLKGIFPTQGSNPGLPHCGRFLYYLSHEGNPLCGISFYFIYFLFLAVLGLCCCLGFSLVVASEGYSLAVV